MTRWWPAIKAFIVLPGMVAYVMPALIARFAPGGPFRPLGLVPMVVGSALLLWCVRAFYVSGKGTLAPWAAPHRLVVTGLYRFTRNPMYVAVSLLLLGWAAAFWSAWLLAYALAAMIGFHLRVVLGEEPWLERLHGEPYKRYCARVPRWLF